MGRPTALPAGHRGAQLARHWSRQGRPRERPSAASAEVDVAVRAEGEDGPAIPRGAGGADRAVHPGAARVHPLRGAMRGIVQVPMLREHAEMGHAVQVRPACWRRGATRRHGCDREVAEGRASEIIWEAGDGQLVCDLPRDDGPRHGRRRHPQIAMRARVPLRLHLGLVTAEEYVLHMPRRRRSDSSSICPVDVLLARDGLDGARPAREIGDA
mmetsp:Transcript_40485/g.114485  ORF Transcript_40485/g.114485 Transcript_40485/m.114485 type:complete len:213 (+) Transcript_40485:344-982(+)